MRESSPAVGGVIVGVVVFLAFVYAFGDSQAFSMFLSNLMDSVGAML